MMLKERHRHGVAAINRRHRGPQQQQNCSRSSTVAPLEVGIIPANRFFLLPLKKVTALVRPYTPCRDSSAISTKPCIIAKTTTTTTTTASSATKPAPPIHGEILLQRSQSKRLIVKHHRHRHSLVAKSPLSTVSLQLHAVPEREPLLWSNTSNNLPTGVVNNNNTRSFKHHISTSVVVTNPAAMTQHRSTSVFSLNEASCREAQAPPPSSSTTTTTLAILQEFGTPAKQKQKQMKMMKKKQKPASSVYNAGNTDHLLRYNYTRTAMKTRFHNSTLTDKDRMASNTSISVRSFGRNNRVSPSSFGHGVSESHPGTFVTNFDTRGDSATPRVKSSKSNKSNNKSNKSRNRSSKVGCSAVLMHKIQSRSPFLCSFTNEKDLPVVVGPAALHLRRSPAKAPANSSN